MTTIKPRDQAYFDIFVTALEGGINYWSLCTAYRWHDPNGAASDTEDVFGFRAIVFETDPDGDPLTRHEIDRAMIAKGVQRFIAYVKENSNLGIDSHFRRAAQDLDWGKWDQLDVDAEVADAIVQLGLFDE